MKAKVIRKFKDKYTGEVYLPDDVIEVTEKRFAEILEVAPLVEAIPEEEAPEEEAPKKKTSRKAK